MKFYSKNIGKYRIEKAQLSKPYPFIKLVRDGKDLVFSLLSF